MFSLDPLSLLTAHKLIFHGFFFLYSNYLIKLAHFPSAKNYLIPAHKFQLLYSRDLEKTETQEENNHGTFQSLKMILSKHGKYWQQKKCREIVILEPLAAFAVSLFAFFHPARGMDIFSQ